MFLVETLVEPSWFLDRARQPRLVHGFRYSILTRRLLSISHRRDCGELHSTAYFCFSLQELRSSSDFFISAVRMWKEEGETVLPRNVRLCPCQHY